MYDLWKTIENYWAANVKNNPPSDDLCACLKDTKSNGIYSAVQWVANHYESGMLHIYHFQIYYIIMFKL